jgi:hypothetical protein
MTDPDIQIDDDEETASGAQYDIADDGGLYVDFSDQEAASESRDTEPLPSGKYLATITNVDLRESKSEENYGKPYYGIEFTVIDSVRGPDFNNRKAWTNAMLWSGALYTITHVMKAVGMQTAAGRMRIPSPEELIGKVVVIGGTLKPGTNKKTGEKYEPRYEPRFFAPEGQWAAIKAGGSPTSGGTMTAKRSAGSAHLLS